MMMNNYKSQIIWINKSITWQFNYCLLKTALFRNISTDVLEDEEQSDGVLFIHQSIWQQKLLRLYGSDICLIDSTYKTTVYGLPLLVLCVSSNVGYFNVASMLLSDETEETICAGLRKIASWNPDWKPQYFMSDFCEAQFSAIESVFQGLLTSYYLCALIVWHFVVIFIIL